MRLIGSGFVDSEAGDLQYRRMRTGWKRALARLKVFVEQIANGRSHERILIRALIAALGLWLATRWVPGITAR